MFFDTFWWNVHSWHIKSASELWHDFDSVSKGQVLFFLLDLAENLIQIPPKSDIRETLFPLWQLRKWQMAAFANLRPAMFIYSEFSAVALVFFRVRPRYTRHSKAAFFHCWLFRHFSSEHLASQIVRAPRFSAPYLQRAHGAPKHATRHAAVSQKAYFNTQNTTWRLSCWK